MSGLFKTKTPQVKAPTPMPDREDPEIKAERARKAAEMKRRGGRESTILSDAIGGKLGAAR